MALAGVSTIGIEFGYALESTAGTKPSAFKKLTRINSIGGITLDTEQIDASSLEDYVTRYVAGRQDTGGSWPITVNITDDVVTEWETLISTFNARENKNLQMWWVVWSPYLTKAFYVVAEPPQAIPMSDMSQNELQTVEIGLTINEYKGMDTAIRPTTTV